MEVYPAIQKDVAWDRRDCY